MAGGTTVPGRTLQLSLMTQNCESTQPAPMWTKELIDALEICVSGPMKTLSPMRIG